MADHDLSLSALFAAVLAGLAWPAGHGCGGGEGPSGPCASPYIYEVDAEEFAGALADGDLSQEECEQLCESGARSEAGPDYYGLAGSVHRCEETPEAWSEEGNLTCYIVDCAYGRRPKGLASEGLARGPDPLAVWLAEAAHLEAASVPAFERLADALAQHGAPAALIDRTRAAADDERCHANSMRALAVRFGGVPVEPAISESTVASLVEIACDNAVQGCVGETWAALLTHFQARACEILEIAEAASEIAADETHHAELAWAIDAWLRTRLSPDACARVDRERRVAVARLRERVAAWSDEHDLRHAGLPSRSTALALFEGLFRGLWARRPSPQAC